MLFRYQLGKTQRHPLPRPFFALNPGARLERPVIGRCSTNAVCYDSR